VERAVRVVWEGEPGETIEEEVDGDKECNGCSV